MTANDRPNRKTLEESMEKALLNLLQVLNKTAPVPMLEASIMQNGFLAQAISGYLSYLSQEGVHEQTEALIKWNRILAVSTVILASATIILAIASFLR
jgi:hypothetical protein